MDQRGVSELHRTASGVVVCVCVGGGLWENKRRRVETPGKGRGNGKGVHIREAVDERKKALDHHRNTDTV